MSKKKFLFFLILLSALSAFFTYDQLRFKYPANVAHYQELYNAMNTLEYKQKLLNYTGLMGSEDYYTLLEWMRTKLIYAPPYIPGNSTTIPLPGDPCDWNEEGKILDRFNGERAEMPIAILQQTKDAYGKQYPTAIGRCGEFSLCYTGLLLACNIQVRLIVDCSYSQTKTAGDHMWVEVFVLNNIHTPSDINLPRPMTWCHVDPTQNVINDPKMYVNAWSKEVNLVYAISSDGIEIVTETYK